MSAPPLLQARGLSVKRRGETVLSQVDLSVSAGEIVTIIGPNGSGKTTLIRSILGLAKADAGTVERTKGLRIGYVPQSLSIDDTLPLTVDRFLAMGADTSDVQSILAEVGISNALLSRPIQAVSGGERRRITLARALLRKPDLLVLDEPTAGVDVTGQVEFYDLLRRVRDERGCGIVLVSHDLHLVMAATDHVICLNRHVCCDGRPESVTQHPEYLSLFGPDAAGALAVYTHHHDHHHDLSGATVADDHDHDGCNHG